MWRPTMLRRVTLPLIKENTTLSRLLYSTKSRAPRSTVKLTLISASVGVLVGAGYGGYTHYKINTKKLSGQTENEEFAFLKEAPAYKSHYKVINEADTSNLQLVLFQYQTCPFCCKVRAYLDARGLSYEIVEVDAVLRQAINWSSYKKVPQLLAKVDGGFQTLLDSSAILSILETHLRDKTYSLQDIVKFYPLSKFQNDSGKITSDVTNKYFIMHNSPVPDEKQRNVETEEREWRQWADKVLVHTLSPNVYRTARESLETFKWFEEAGGWRQKFPDWECVLMVYVGAAAMWLIAKRLKARHNIQDDVRQSLYDAVNDWMDVIHKKGTPFLGGNSPNLADISVYGILSSIEGCKAFHDLKDNTDIGKWFDNMKISMKETRGRMLAV